MIDRRFSSISNSAEQAKTFDVEELHSVFSRLQSDGHSVGLIGGCFDVLHMGHIDLFRFAKRHVDFLCVLLDNDDTIRSSKGVSRPLFNEKVRADQIAELKSVDMVAIWDEFIPSGSDRTDDIWCELLNQTRPDVHITNVDADTFWQKKQQLCEKLHIRFLGYRRNRLSSSTELMDQMMEHFIVRDF